MKGKDAWHRNGCSAGTKGMIVMLLQKWKTSVHQPWRVSVTLGGSGIEYVLEGMGGKLKNCGNQSLRSKVV